ncbi:flagellar FlbD family protein [Aquipuribacter hungaricus]|uniref:Flagellar FlbD family protein n=1 Tax=Aquipuribacter hungaricus TaxID=545624 RepID=A0ABV7WLP5_9MICO
MIRLTRLNGSVFSLNPDLIHRAEETPDTVLTLIDGSRYLVVESLEQLVDLVVGYRARVVAQAGLLGEAALGAPATTAHVRPVPDDDSDDDSDHDGHDDGHDGQDDDSHSSHDSSHDRRPTGASVVQLRARRA